MQKHRCAVVFSKLAGICLSRILLQNVQAEAHAVELQAKLDAATATIEQLETRALAAENSVESQVKKWTQLLQEREAQVAELESAVAEAQQRAEETEQKAHERLMGLELDAATLRKELEVCVNWL